MIARQATFEVLLGDVLDMLRKLPDNHFHMSISSPPYWGLRDYDVEGQIGLEDQLDAFIEKLVLVYRELRRVLRDDGLNFVNIADSYAQDTYKRKADKRNTIRTKERRYTTQAFARVEGWERSANTARGSGLARKQLIMQSAMLARALQLDGWYIRSSIKWHKPNPMPCGAQDRCALDYEDIWMMSPSDRYYYDQHGWRMPSGAKSKTTWTIPIYTKKDHKHHASFPPELPRRAILLSTSDHGVCSSCGSQYQRIVKAKDGYAAKLGASWNNHEDDLKRGQRGAPSLKIGNPWITVGWEASCECKAEVVPARVLDPFSGSGTTGEAALKLGRDYTGIELNPEYLEVSRERLEAARIGIPVREMRSGQQSLLDGCA